VPPTSRISYDRDLNPAQHEAVTATEGPVLVIAGAGSGKTRTLVYRVAYLLEKGVRPGNILLLTFTRRAAEEMLRRASTLVGVDCGMVAGGTFHAFGNMVLSRYGHLAGYDRDFTILDRGDSEDVINLVRSHLHLDRRERRFPKKGLIAEVLSMAVNCGVPLADLLERRYPHLLDELEAFVGLEEAYRRYKLDKHLVDYDDLLVRLRDGLRSSERLAETLSSTYRYIMVDEYQDTNHLQAEIVRLLARGHENVMVVGDDAQSIYSFRGANFRNIMEFPRLFPGAKLIKLEENYRSTQPILDLANEIIDRAREKYTKVLFTERGGGARPVLVQAPDERWQSRFVCQKILELREDGVPLEEMAVLFRSSFHSFDLEIELARCDIPFVKRGGFKFIETAHVKDVLAYLRIVVNPRDEVSWHRLLLLIEGVGPKGAREILSWVIGRGEVAEALESFSAKGSKRAELVRLAELFRRIASATPAPASCMELVLEHYKPIVERKYRDDYPKRLRDLEHLVAIARRYRSLSSMLVDMALEPPTDSVGGILAAEKEDEGLLTLSTIHSAKGLEWHTVFIIWAAEGRFPAWYSVHDEDEMEEERRLMYVAVTRAKENLFIAYPIEIYDRSSGVVLGAPSRFLEGLSEKLIEPVALTEDVLPSGGL